MKATTKFQKDIIQKSMKLRPVTKSQAEWAIRECFDHYAYRLKSGKTTCMDCGHTWDTDGKTDKCVCPHCGMKLEVKNTQDRKISGKMYFNVLGMTGKYRPCVCSWFSLKCVRERRLNTTLLKSVSIGLLLTDNARLHDLDAV